MKSRAVGARGEGGVGQKTVCESVKTPSVHDL